MTLIFLSKYLGDEEISIGLKSETLLKGTLKVNKKNPSEATILVDENKIRRIRESVAKNIKLLSPTEVFIQSLENMNRAIDGDQVVVQILPTENWKSPSKKLIAFSDSSENQKKDEDLGHENSFYVTGCVVGVIKRNWRSYVATIQVDTDTNQRFVLCVPMDYKIPKIRIKILDIKNFENQRILVNIDDWPEDSRQKDFFLNFFF